MSLFYSARVAAEMAPAGKHALGSRVSAPFGAKIDPAVFDDGAPQPAGTAGESVRTRRAAAFRQRIYGTISASVDKKQWQVKWDSPNYMLTPTACSSPWKSRRSSGTSPRELGLDRTRRTPRGESQPPRVHFLPHDINLTTNNSLFPTFRRRPQPPDDDDPDRYSLDPDDFSDDEEREDGGRRLDDRQPSWEEFDTDSLDGDDDWQNWDEEEDDDAADENHPSETAEQRHARRTREADAKIRMLRGTKVKVNDTEWTVVEEHHATSSDFVGKAELVNFGMSHDVDLLRLFLHLYPGSPERDIDRANRYMTHWFARWKPITTHEWIKFLGLLYGGSLFVQKVRRRMVSSRTAFTDAEEGD